MPHPLLTELLKHHRIAILSHIKPDGDCLGAQFAFARWFKNMGKRVDCYNRDGVPDYLTFLAQYGAQELINTQDLSQKLESADAVLIVDGNAPNRFGEDFEKWAQNPVKPLYCLDHHPDADLSLFHASYINTSMSSSCEMTYHLLNSHENGTAYFDPETAKCLYTGIITDTGSHAFDSVSPATLRASAHLMEIGEFKANEIHEALYSTRSMNEIRLLGKALNTLETHEDGQIATIEIHSSFYEQTQTTPDQTEGIVNYALSIEGVKAAIFFKEVPGEDFIKMSLRSKSSLNVNLWAKPLNGGGHAKAAGARMQGTLAEVKAKALEIGKKMIMQQTTT